MDKVKLGDFLVDFQAGTLRNNQQVNKLEPQVLAFLRVLIDQPGKVIERQHLLKEIWQERQVSDDAIRAVVRKLREALHDDARNPSYIKTLPLKGYQLIAPVQQVGTRLSLTPWLTSAAIIMLVSLTFIINSFTNKPTQASVQYLTQMAGSEMLADYHEGSNALLFSHRFDNPDPLQIYVKNLTSGQVKRLTWGEEEHKYGLWSPSGEQVAYTLIKGNLQRYFIADFDFISGFRNMRELDIAVTDKNLLGWSADGLSLYFSDSYRSGFAKGLFRFELAQNRLVSLTKPSVEGAGDFFAKESHDGNRLAILRAVDSSRVELIIMALDDDKHILANRVLPILANRLAWQPDNQGMVLSSFTGALRHYDLSGDVFTDVAGVNANTNDIIHLCAEKCMMLREHNGNFLDIQEQPNPFISEANPDTEYFDLPSADDFPFYSHDGNAVYFVSQTESALLLQRQDRYGVRQQLAQFERKDRLENLSISADGKRVLGQLNKRIFILDIASTKVDFLTTDLEVTSNPSWASDGQHVYLNKLENDQPTIYKVNTYTRKQQRLHEDYISLRDGPEGKQYAVNANLDLVELNTVGEVRQLTRLKHSSINLWRLHENTIYIMQRAGNTAAELIRLNLDSGILDSQIIAPHRFRLNFDLHPNGETLLIVKSLIAQSNIVKVNH